MITVESLLEDIRTTSKIPKGQLDDTTVLRVATNLLMSRVISQLITNHENYYRHTETVKVSASDPIYRFPSGAIGGGLLEVLYKSSENSQDFENLPQHFIEKKTQKGLDLGFILTAGGLELWPTPTQDIWLEVHFLLRPGKLIKSIHTYKVELIDTSSHYIQVNTLPIAITSSSNIDVMKSDGLTERVVIGEKVTSISDTKIFITDPTLLSKVTIGDTVALTGYSPYVQIPEEYSDYLVALVAQRMAQLTGNSTLYKMMGETIKETKPDILNLVDPRVKEEVVGVNIEWD